MLTLLSWPDDTQLSATFTWSGTWLPWKPGKGARTRLLDNSAEGKRPSFEGRVQSRGSNRGSIAVHDDPSDPDRASIGFSNFVWDTDRRSIGFSDGSERCSRLSPGLLRGLEGFNDGRSGSLAFETPINPRFGSLPVFDTAIDLRSGPASHRLRAEDPEKLADDLMVEVTEGKPG